MSLEQLKALFAKVKGDSKIQEKLKAANSSNDVASLAKEHGYTISHLYLQQISDEDFKLIQGGLGCVMIKET